MVVVLRQEMYHGFDLQGVFRNPGRDEGNAFEKCRVVGREGTSDGSFVCAILGAVGDAYFPSISGQRFRVYFRVKKKRKILVRAREK